MILSQIPVAPVDYCIEADPPEGLQRLLVLVLPDQDNFSMIQRAWQLAVASGRPVLLVGLCRSLAGEPSLRRQMATLSAFMRNGSVPTETRVQTGKSWGEVLQAHYRPGDMIICRSDPYLGTLPGHLADFRGANPHVPVYILSEIQPRKTTRAGWLPRLAAWAGLLVILTGCTFSQLKIAGLPWQGLQNILFILSTFLEIWLIWIWNRWLDSL